MTEISVIMAVFNGGNDVIRAIESVQKQTFKSFQFIIVDDCSTDGTPDKITKYLRNSSIRWNLIQNKYNMGNEQTALKAYQNCNSKWMIRIDHDDEFCNNTLETLINDSDGYDMVYGSYLEIFPTDIRTVVPSNPMECLACGMLYNTKSIASAGGYLHLDVGIFMEYDLNIRLINNGAKILTKPDIVYKYYRRSGSVTHNKDKVTDSINKIKEKWGDKWANQIRKY